MSVKRRYLTKVAASKGMTLKILAYRAGIMTVRMQNYFRYQDFSNSEKECIAKVLDMRVDEIFNEGYKKEREEYHRERKEYLQKSKNTRPWTKRYLTKRAVQKGMTIQEISRKTYIPHLSMVIKVGSPLSETEKSRIAEVLNFKVDELFNNEYEVDRIRAYRAHQLRNKKYRRGLSQRTKLNEMIHNTGTSLAGYAKKIGICRHRLRRIVMDGIKTTEKERTLITDVLGCKPDDIF